MIFFKTHTYTAAFPSMEIKKVLLSRVLKVDFSAFGNKTISLKDKWHIRSDLHMTGITALDIL